MNIKETQLSSNIAQNIKKYRQLNNMTQKDLSEKLYLDTQYYAQLERGERNFTIEKICMICSLFHIGIDDIIQVNQDETLHEDYSALVEELSLSLKQLNYSQLLVLKKYIEEIAPHTR
jgi:transcriptional regulator with XRE-family HTH domain